MSSGESSLTDLSYMTTVGPYLDGEQKSPVVHIMKKYRPPPEKYNGPVGCTEQTTASPIDEKVRSY